MMEYKSKTEKKKDAVALQKLGEVLLDVSADEIKGFDLPAEIHDAIIFAKTIKSHGAFRRQMQLIGTFMRNTDPVPIQEAFENIDRGNYKKAMDFKETEMWRDELINGNKTLMEEILNKCPDADRQQLAQLVRNAVKEKANDKPPKSSRVLFRYLKNCKIEYQIKRGEE